MKTYIKTIALAITPILFLNSCVEEDSSLDTTKPEIILASPTDHQEYELGDIIDVQAILKDNEELGAYKIEIHSAGDGHNHGDENHQHKNATSDDHHDHDHEAWSYNEEGNIFGKEYILNKSITIPSEDIEEGHYHLGVFVIDKAGNQSQTFIEIVIGEDHHH